MSCPQHYSRCHRRVEIHEWPAVETPSSIATLIGVARYSFIREKKRSACEGREKEYDNGHRRTQSWSMHFTHRTRSCTQGMRCARDVHGIAPYTITIEDDSIPPSALLLSHRRFVPLLLVRNRIDTTVTLPQVLSSKPSRSALDCVPEMQACE